MHPRFPWQVRIGPRAEDEKTTYRLVAKTKPKGLVKTTRTRFTRACHHLITFQKKKFPPAVLFRLRRVRYMVISYQIKKSLEYSSSAGNTHINLLY